MFSQHEKSTETKTPIISRRQVLKAMGAGSVLVACSAFLKNGLPVYQAYAAGETESNDLLTVKNVDELKSIPASKLKDGQVIYVTGYRIPGDGGQKNVVYIASSMEADNGGTVHKPKGALLAGAWHVIHNGVGDFRWFGIFDEGISADNALDYLVNDLTLHKIEAHSNLLLNKRHEYSRSNLDIDFNNFTIFTYGTEDAKRDDPFAAIMLFRGQKMGPPITVTLPAGPDGKDAVFFEDTDFFYVGNNSNFASNQWYFVETDVRPRAEIPGRKPIGGGSSDKEIQKLVMVTKVGKSVTDTEYAEFNYLCAWGLSTGRKITYQRINPVFDVNISNMKFEGQGHSDISGAAPIAHEFCVDCNITNIYATKVFWPLNIRRYCTSYQVHNCQLINAEEVKMGGTGYLVQQIGCLYAHVSDCRAYNTRHLNDFTGCAYSLVENCHCTGDENGAFVTHGQYDHDLTYIGNSGFLSFANSALNATSPHTWGGWHKRIVVKRHNAPRVVFENKMNRVADLTLEDCNVHYDASRYGSNAGSVWANTDGLVMRNCTMGALSLGQDSEISNRPTLIENCSIKMEDGLYLTRHRKSGFEVTRDITFRNCNFYNIGLNYLVMGKTITFENCHFYANDKAAVSRLNVESEHVRIIGGGFHGVCFAFDIGGTTDVPVGPQRLTVDGGAVFEGSNNSKALIDIKNNDFVTLNFSNAAFIQDNGMETIHFPGTGKISLHASGTTFQNVVLPIPSSVISAESYVMVTSCIMKNSSITAPTDSSPAVIIQNNLNLP